MIKRPDPIFIKKMMTTYNKNLDDYRYSIVKIKANYAYYFDYEFKYQRIKISDLDIFDCWMRGVFPRYLNIRSYAAEIKYNEAILNHDLELLKILAKQTPYNDLKEALSINVIDTRLNYYNKKRLNLVKVKSALNQLNIGDSFDTFLEKYEEACKKIPVKREYTELELFVLKISSPSIERYNDNVNKDTFDLIRVEISIPTKDNRPDRMDYFKKHFNEISEMVLDKIKSSKKFTKYGVPINILKCESAKLMYDSTVEMLFTLKCE